ncbi:hypothetical protein GCM10008957_30250 [Deinococcus ruber]|uniref:Uncharacterized protein n=1 Tax=Deinococcus ruber TaxID=1848197 RepID=A0A918F8G6_9DEIO|nr:hypothetical protein GCM10008957_30250 [Deinococcus ruber]
MLYVPVRTVWLALTVTAPVLLVTLSPSGTSLAAMVRPVTAVPLAVPLTCTRLLVPGARVRVLGLRATSMVVVNGLANGLSAAPHAVRARTDMSSSGTNLSTAGDLRICLQLPLHQGDALQLPHASGKRKAPRQ